MQDKAALYAILPIWSKFWESDRNTHFIGMYTYTYACWYIFKLKISDILKK